MTPISVIPNVPKVNKINRNKILNEHTSTKLLTTHAYLCHIDNGDNE